MTTSDRPGGTEEDLHSPSFRLSIGNWLRRPRWMIPLSGPNGAVPDDFQVWQWSQGADNTIALFIFPKLPAGMYAVQVALPDGRKTSADFQLP